MYKFHCLNNISPIGLKNFTSKYEQVDEIDDAQGILVRSAAMHDMEFSDNLLAIARAGAGVNNIPLKRCAEKGFQHTRCQRQRRQGACFCGYAAGFP